MLKVLFDINQLFFLKFQRRDVLNSDSELEHEQFEDEALEQYKDLLAQVKLADSSKRDEAKDKIRTELQKYHGKPLTQKDFRVLQGVLSYRFKNLEQKEVVRDQLQEEKQSFKQKIQETLSLPSHEFPLRSLQRV